MRLDWLRTLAVGAKGVFGERYDLDPQAGLLPEPDLLAIIRASSTVPLDRLAEHCSVACSNTGDKGCVAAMSLVDAGRALLERPPADVDQIAAALYALPVKDHGERRPAVTRATGARLMAAKTNS